MPLKNGYTKHVIFLKPNVADFVSIIPFTSVLCSTVPANIYLLKVNNKNIRKRWEICSKLTIRTPERCHWHCSGGFIINSEYISHLCLVFIVNFEQVSFKILENTEINRSIGKNWFKVNLQYVDPKQLQINPWAFYVIFSFRLPHFYKCE